MCRVLQTGVYDIAQLLPCPGMSFNCCGFHDLFDEIDVTRNLM